MIYQNDQPNKVYNCCEVSLNLKGRLLFKKKNALLNILNVDFLSEAIFKKNHLLQRNCRPGKDAPSG